MTGTNGSGKTTPLRATLGLHRTTTGLIEIGGRRAASAAGWARRRRDVAWIPQRQAAGRLPLLAGELLDSSGAPVGAHGAARELGVGTLRERPLNTLSGGQLQRMYLARAMGCIAAGAGLLARVRGVGVIGGAWGRVVCHEGLLQGVE